MGDDGGFERHDRTALCQRIRDLGRGFDLEWTRT
jgi:hypothetical protein